MSASTKIVSVHCHNCTYTEAQMLFCGIRKYQFTVFGLKCPREQELQE